MYGLSVHGEIFSFGSEIGMRLLTAFEEGRLVVSLRGELDQHCARSLMAELSALIDQYLPRDCVLDLAGLKFMDSSGIAVILRTHRRMNEIGGRVWVENPPAQPYKVIAASGIERIVSVKTVLKEAKT